MKDQTLKKEIENLQSSISHDLRAPIRAISGYASILSDEFKQEMSSEALSYVHKIIAASHKLNNRLNGIVEISRIKQKNISNKSINLDTLIKKVIQNEKLPEGKIHHNLDTAFSLKTDGELLTTLFSEILKNFIEVTKAKNDPIIIIDAMTDKNSYKISFINNGEPINEQDTSNIFSMYYKIPSLSNENNEGIGLCKVKVITDKLGYNIEVTDNQFGGVTFILTIPREN